MNRRGFAVLPIILMTAAVVGFLAALYLTMTQQFGTTQKTNATVSTTVNTNVTKKNDDQRALSLIPEGTEWVNAYEEGALIYRNSKYYSPPPSRFRHSFIYHQRKCESLQLASNDAHYLKEVDCSITQDGDTTIFELGIKTYEIQELTNEKMALSEL